MSFFLECLPSTVYLPTILKTVFFCVQLDKETHTGLEQHEGEDMSSFSFSVNYPFKKMCGIMFISTK